MKKLIALIIILMSVSNIVCQREEEGRYDPERYYSGSGDFLVDELEAQNPDADEEESYLDLKSDFSEESYPTYQD